MIVAPIKTRVFKENENLVDFITNHIPKLKNGSVLIVTSKIVALAEGRTEERVDLTTKEKLIRRESDFALPTKWVWLTLKDNLVVASAGIDESNANGKFILLPKDSQRSAVQIRTTLMKHYKVKRLGVIVPDSRTVPLRAGAIGLALGYAGIRGLRDYRGKKDIFGRKFKFERVNVVDCLASAAMVAMGDGDEQCPLAVIEDANVEFVESVRRSELRIPLEDDMYLPFIGQLPIVKQARARMKK